MGIPSYAKRLLRSNKVTQDPESIDNLLIDFNGMIHPSSHKVIKKYKELRDQGHSVPSAAVIETAIIKQCCTDLKAIVALTNPTKRLIVAADGVCPMGKMFQQRLRRFKIKDESEPDIFDGSSITPGTTFMDKLNKRIRVFVEKSFSGLTVHYSGSDEPGEGEHKLINRLRTDPDLAEDTSVLFGLDADLIMLCLSTHIQSLYIFREEQDPQVIKSFGNYNYISLEKVREYLLDDVHLKTGRNDINLHNVINDYILLCFFGGNDFVPHLPSIEIKCGGLDRILEMYWEHLRNGGNYLTLQGCRLSPQYFKQFLGVLAEKEEEMVLENARLNKQRSNGLENDLVYHDPVEFHRKGWEFRYYERNFHTDSVDTVEVNQWCQEYLTMIEWNLIYYSGKCIDNQMYYRHLKTPTLRDIYRYLCRIDFHFTKFVPRDYCTPHEQLLCVLPPSSKALIPKKYYSLLTDDLVHYYPVKCQEDTAYCTMQWQCKVVFPPVDFHEIIEKARRK